MLKEAVPLLRETTSLHTRYGTLQHTEIIYGLGAYPLLNFQSTVDEGMEKLFADSIAQNFTQNTRCFGCPIACGKLCEVKSGRYRDVKVKPEYEMLWSLGAHCGIFDLDTILTGNHLCNLYGMDAITAGYMVGFLMELNSRGLVPKAKLDSLNVKFGDDGGMLQLIEMMAEGKGIGKVLALGPKEAGEVLGHGASYYSLHVRGMSLTGYEPRAFYGMALTFGSSSRGACHNVGGWTIRDELIKKTVDRYALKGKGILVKVLQDVRAYINSLGICTVPRHSLGLTDEPNNELLRLVTGLDHESLMSIGERIYSLERLILNREGISRRDDLIPERLRREPLNDGSAKGHVITDEMYDEMLDEYYAARSWD